MAVGRSTSLVFVEGEATVLAGVLTATQKASLESWDAKWMGGWNNKAGRWTGVLRS